MTSSPMFNATSSPGSASGATPCAVQAGPTTAPSGPALVPVSPSAWRAPVLALTTLDISGRSGFGSSASDALTRSLVSRLQQRARGSILYRLTWKVKALPSGRSIYRLRASPGRTSVSDLSGWPTARSADGAKNVRSLEGALREIERKGLPQVLGQAALLAGWPSPMAGTPAQNGNNEAGSNDSSRRTVFLAGWTTAAADDTGARQEKYAQGGSALSYQAVMTGWATTTRDHRSDRGRLTSEELYGSKGQPLVRQVLYPDATGSSVETASSGLLNPEHSRWLQRLPAEWGSCAPTATLSTLKRRRSS